MKKLILTIQIILFTVMIVSAQYQKQLSKAKKKQLDKKVKELKNQGYQPLGSNTLEVDLLEHYIKLEDTNNEELIGISENCPSINICKAAAQTFAYNSYAQEVSTYARGSATGDIDQEAEKFYNAFEQLYAVNLSNVVKLSMMVKKTLEAGKVSVQLFYIVNQVKAKEIAKSSVDEAIKKTNGNIEYGDKIKKYLDGRVSK